MKVNSFLILLFFVLGGTLRAQSAQIPDVQDRPLNSGAAKISQPQEVLDNEKQDEAQQVEANPKVTPPKSPAEIQKAEKNFLLQLKRRINKDQKTRNAIISYRQRTKEIDPERIKKLYKKASDVDGDNLEWLRSHIDQYGWPPRSAIGKQRAYEFFILVLHADRDSQFQQRCLDLIAKMPKDDWSTSQYRQLDFRIKMLSGGRYENMDLPTTPLPRPKSKSKQAKGK